MNIRLGEKLWKKFQQVVRFGTVRIIRVGIDIADVSGSVNYIRRRNRQFPLWISIYVRQIYKRSLVDRRLIFRNFITEPEPTSHFISGVAKQWKYQMMLVCHQIRLVDGLWRNCDKRGPSPLNVRINRIHRLHLSDAERTPASTEKNYDQRTLPKQFGGFNQFSVLVRKLKSRSLVALLQRTVDDSRGSQFFYRPPVDCTNLLRNILLNQFLTFGIDLTQRTDFLRRCLLK